MKRTIFCTLRMLVLAGLPVVARAQDDDEDPGPSLRICSLYGALFYYIPGTGICINPTTGDSREQTQFGTFRTFIRPPEGKFTNNLASECAPGRVVNLGTFKSTDLTLDPLPTLLPDENNVDETYVYDRKHSVPLNLALKTNEFVSEVAMSGGFYDPRTPSSRSGTNFETGPCRPGDAAGTYDCGSTVREPGLCLFSFDTEVIQAFNGPTFFPYGNLPVGCIANARLRSMPATYVVSPTAAHPRMGSGFDDGTQTHLETYVYGKQVLLSTNVGGGATLLTYHDPADGMDKPLAGKVTVSVCVMTGVPALANP